MKLSGKNVLVTGGAGFIGSHLVDELLASGCRQVVVVDNLFLGKKKNLVEAEKSGRMAFYEENAGNEARMHEIINKHGVEVVFNLAVIPLPASLEKPEFCIRENITITLAACELLRKGAYQKLVQYSSSEVYGSLPHGTLTEKHPLDPLTPYAASKAATDHMAISYHHTFGLNTVIVRPFNNYGPRQNEGSYAGIIPITVKRILAGEAPVIYGSGEQTRDFTFVKDTAKATIKICEKDSIRGMAINIGSGRETRIKDLVELICGEMDCRKKILHEAPRPGDVMRHQADITLVKELIDYAPKVELKDGMRETIAWYVDLYKSSAK